MPPFAVRASPSSLPREELVSTPKPVPEQAQPLASMDLYHVHRNVRDVAGSITFYETTEFGEIVTTFMRGLATY